MPHTKAYVWFAIYGCELDPDEITARSGIVPTQIWRQGDEGPLPKMQRRQNGWKVQSRLPQEATAEAQINDVMDQLGGDTTALLKIEGGERLLCCALYMYDFDRPPGRVPARAVRVCAALGAEIDIDLYPLRSRSE